MSDLRLITLALACGMWALPAPGDDDVLLRNWTPPPYWSPPAAAEGAKEAGRAVSGSGREAMALPSSALPFVAIPPCRIVDTRGGAPFTGGKVLAGESRDYQFSAAAAPCTGIPVTAAAFSLNFTVTQTDGAGFLAAYPRNGRPVPLVSTLNYTGGQTIANGAVVPGDATGFVTVIAGVSGTHVIIDVNGYYAGTGMVTSLNAKAGDVTLLPGTNVTITPSGNTLTVASPAALTGVTAGSGIAVSGGAPSPTVLIPPSGILADRIASGQVVKSLNGLADGVTIAGTGGTTVSAVGSTITVASPPMSGLVMSGYSARTFGAVATDNWGCVDFDTTSYSQIRLDLPLPNGAVISGVKVKIRDASAASEITLQLRSAGFPAGTGVSIWDGVASDPLSSPDNSDSNVPLTGLLTSTPASATLSYYIFASAPAHTGLLSFCGASVAFTVD
jgi:hypothetical protein